MVIQRQAPYSRPSFFNPIQLKPPSEQAIRDQLAGLVKQIKPEELKLWSREKADPDPDIDKAIIEVVFQRYSDQELMHNIAGKEAPFKGFVEALSKLFKPLSNMTEIRQQLAKQGFDVDYIEPDE